MDGLNWYVYCSSNPINNTDPTGKWKSDVHYDDTKRWAKEAGFSNDDAETLANYDNFTDNVASGKSPVASDQTYHFDRNPSVVDSRMEHAKQRLNDAIWQKNQASINYSNSMAALDPNDAEYEHKRQQIERQYEREKEYALALLGEGLHALQDVDAHGQIGVNDLIASHVGMEGVDDRNYDWTDNSCTNVQYSGEQKRYNSTKSWTMWYLNQYLSGRTWME